MRGGVSSLADVDAFREQLHAQYGQLSDSTVGIVEDREHRG